MSFKRPLNATREAVFFIAFCGLFCYIVAKRFEEGVGKAKFKYLLILRKIMKRKYVIIILALSLLLAAGCRETDNSEKQEVGTIKIASFNIRIFSSNSRDDEELGYIVDVLEKYDVIAIQELRDEEVLERAVAMLENRGKEYEYEISDEVGRAVKERYGFLYRKGIVKKVRQGRLYEEENDEFIREPFYATFKAENFDFTLITIHVLYGSSKVERRPEIRELATVYQKVQDEDPTEQDVIILGDFNFPPTDEGFDNLKSIPTMAFLFAPPLKTTITDTSLYDNFWFQEEYLREYADEFGIDRFDETMFSNDDHKAKLAVSDHRPVWAKFDTGRPDDD